MIRKPAFRLFTIGAHFVVPNAEHHCHFAMWDSALTTWDAKDRGPKRDIVGDLCAAVRKRGMRFDLSNHRARGWNFYTYKPEFDTMDPEFSEFYWPQLGREKNVVAIRVYSKEQKAGLVAPPGHITIENR